MNYILFDGSVRNALLPFTYTRPVADIRVGILTIREKWERRIGVTTTTLTEEYLEEKFPMVEMEQNIMINASFLPTDQLVEELKELKENQALIYKEDIVAFFTTVIVYSYATSGHPLDDFKNEIENFCNASSI